MRGLLLWGGVAALAGVTYVSWPPPPALEDGPPASSLANVEEPVPFLVRAKMRQILAEWKNLAVARSAGDRNAAWIKIELAVNDIRQRVRSDGGLADGAVRQAMLAAARQLGHTGSQSGYVIDAVLQGPSSSEGNSAAGGGGGIVGKLREAAGLPEKMPQ